MTSTTPSPVRTRPAHRRRGPTLVVAGLATLGLATPALAVTMTMGNPAIDRDNVDSWTNSITVDTNNPAPFDGYFTRIDYFAERQAQLRFVVVDATGTVTWVSDTIASDPGAGTLELDGPVGVSAGSNLGVNTTDAAVISYTYDSLAAPILQTYGGGAAVVGDQPAFLDPDTLFQPNRVYSMNADVEASSPQICKAGGWETYGYKNQGQCIASVVANDRSGH